MNGIFFTFDFETCSHFNLTELKWRNHVQVYNNFVASDNNWREQIALNQLAWFVLIFENHFQNKSIDQNHEKEAQICCVWMLDRQFRLSQSIWCRSNGGKSCDAYQCSTKKGCHRSCLVTMSALSFLLSYSFTVVVFPALWPNFRFINRVP